MTGRTARVQGPAGLSRLRPVSAGFIAPRRRGNSAFPLSRHTHAPQYLVDHLSADGLKSASLQYGRIEMEHSSYA